MRDVFMAEFYLSPFAPCGRRGGIGVEGYGVLDAETSSV